MNWSTGSNARPDAPKVSGRPAAFARMTITPEHTPGMLSVIIPAHDEARLIGATLDAARRATATLGIEIEFIVVDDASTDATARIANARGARVIRVEHRHIAATRNAGAREARGDRLLFLDADTEVDAAVIAATIRALDEGAVGGGATVRLAGPQRWHVRLAIALSIVLFRATRIAPGCYIFCTRLAFDAAGGFDERLFAAEDVAISRALRRVGRFVILRDAVTTSARKVRTFGLLDHARLVLRFMLRGRAALRSRDALGLWYGPRRDEP